MVGGGGVGGHAGAVGVVEGAEVGGVGGVDGGADGHFFFLVVFCERDRRVGCLLTDKGATIV